MRLKLSCKGTNYLSFFIYIYPFFLKKFFLLPKECKINRGTFAAFETNVPQFVVCSS
jgi:hypothetical protein